MHKAVATQISEATAENLAQYAKAADLETTNGNVTTLTFNQRLILVTRLLVLCSAAIDAIKLVIMLKAADLTLLAGRVTTLEGKVADLKR